jgi:membrane protein implicated in regulation of membrane protease activity
MFDVEITPALIWIVVAVIFATIELATMGIITIWFAVGAVAASIGSIFELNVFIQFMIFLVVSIGLLYFTRPIAEKYLKIGKQKTNMDSIVGEKAVIIETVEPFKTGQAKIRGQVWSFEGINSSEQFENGEEVIVEKIEGVRLLVKKAGE